MVSQLTLNSLDLAAQLAEPHHQVLQCVDGLIADGIERSRFCETRYRDAGGFERRCVDMTTEAVVLVSMRLGTEKPLPVSAATAQTSIVPGAFGGAIGGGGFSGQGQDHLVP